MRQLLLSVTILVTIALSAQVQPAKINETTKKLVMLEAKSDGSVVNIKFDSLLVKTITMRSAVSAYLNGTLLKSGEIQRKYDTYKSQIIGKPSQEQLDKSLKYLSEISKITDRQKVLIFEKLDNADNSKKIIVHSKAIYYLKLDDDITDGHYQNDYYYTTKGVLIPDIYEYFLLNIK